MDKITCSVDDCERESKTRGWCMMHYQQQYRGVPIKQAVVVLVCPECGIEFHANNAKKYCSQRCREVLKYRTMREDPEAWARNLDLLRSRYTKKTEQPGYVNPNYKGYTCSEEHCGRQRQSRGMCPMHYKRWASLNGMNRPPSSRWSEKKSSNHHARRARMNGSKASDKVLVSKLIADGLTNCAWCGTDIDVTLEYPHRYSKSLDHTIPIARGGNHTLDNVTLMHLTCNISKGVRPMPAMELPHGKAQRNASETLSLDHF